jgi:hypothetical protein
MFTRHNHPLMAGVEAQHGVTFFQKLQDDYFFAR